MAVGGLLLLLGMLGVVLKERRPVSEPLIALLAGVLIGPAIFGLLDLAELGNETGILEEAALVTPGVALVGVTLRPPVVVLTAILPTLVSQRWFALHASPGGGSDGPVSTVALSAAEHI